MDFNLLAVTIVFFIRSGEARFTGHRNPAAKRPITVDLLTPGFPCFENPMDIQSQPSPLDFYDPLPCD
jgi:hypothetical protein